MPSYPKQLWIRGGGKSGIHLAEVSGFAAMTGKNRHFRDLSQQVLSGVVASTTNIAGIEQLFYIQAFLSIKVKHFTNVVT